MRLDSPRTTWRARLCGSHSPACWALLHIRAGFRNGCHAATPALSEVWTGIYWIQKGYRRERFAILRIKWTDDLHMWTLWRVKTWRLSESSSPRCKSWRRKNLNRALFLRFLQVIDEEVVSWPCFWRFKMSLTSLWTRLAALWDEYERAATAGRINGLSVCYLFVCLSCSFPPIYYFDRSNCW